MFQIMSTEENLDNARRRSLRSVHKSFSEQLDDQLPKLSEKDKKAILKIHDANVQKLSSKYQNEKDDLEKTNKDLQEELDPLKVASGKWNDERSQLLTRIQDTTNECTEKEDEISKLEAVREELLKRCANVVPSAEPEKPKAKILCITDSNLNVNDISFGESALWNITDEVGSIADLTNALKDKENRDKFKQVDKVVLWLGVNEVQEGKFNDCRGSERVFNAYVAAIRELLKLTQVAIMEIPLFTPKGNLSAAPVFNQYVRNINNRLEDVQIIACEKED